MLTGYAPYARSRWPYTRRLQHIVDHGHIALPQPPQIASGVWEIIQGCWARDPQHRPTIAQVVLAIDQHHFD